MVLTVLAAILAPKFTVALGIFGAALAYLILMVVMAAGFVGGAVSYTHLDVYKRQGEDAAGHEDGKWCHVHIIVDITLPVYIRVYGRCV